MTSTGEPVATSGRADDHAATDPGPPAVVTGLGVLAPTGIGTDRWWAATLAGENGIGPLRRFDTSRYATTLAGEVGGFEASAHLPSQLISQTDHMTRMALMASDAALADAGIAAAELEEYSAGVVTASASGGFEFGQRELEKLWRDGPNHVSAYQSFAWFYAVNTGQISIRHGLRGPSGSIVAEQAGGLDAVAAARRSLADGAEMMLTGGVDGSLCPWGLTGQLRSGRLSTATDPDAAYLPFDTRARGHVPAEGGVIMVVERADAWVRAGRRGHPGYGTLAGWGSTMDPPPGSGRPPGLARAVRLALADAALSPGDIDVVLADAAGVPELDRQETEALTALFGERGVPVTAPKTGTGRLYSGGAPLDVAAALLALRDGLIPPTINIDFPADGALDLVRDIPRPAALRHALVVARGYGGFNSALVLSA